MTRSAWKIVLVVTISIGMAGLVINAIAPSDFRSGSMSIEAKGNLIEEFTTSNVLSQHPALNLYLYIDCPSFGNVSVLLVNGTEYQRFVNGTPIENLMPLSSPAEFSDDHHESYDYVYMVFRLTSIDQNQLYLIIANNNSGQAYVQRYASLLCGSYYAGLVVMATGILAMIGALAMHCTGCKRWFFWCVDVNLALFFIRTSLLASFEFIPPIFWNVLQVEIYNDFQFQTIIWTQGFANGIPLYSSALSVPYPFTPLYVCTCWLFNILPIPVWKLAIPLLIFNIMTGYLVFKIVQKLTGDEKRASISMVLYLLNPFTLVYGSFAWLSPPPFVFFVMLAFYLAIIKKNDLAMISLGIGIMYKQYALIFFPLVVIAMLRTSKKASRRGRFMDQLLDMLRYTGICAGVIIGISVPFLLTNPADYVFRAFLSNAGGSRWVNSLSVFWNYDGAAVNFLSFFYLIGTPIPITYALAWLFAFNVPLAICGAYDYARFALLKRKWSSNRSEMDETTSDQHALFAECLFAAMVMIFCMHLFFAYGVYKYYFILLAPFIAIFFDPGRVDLRQAIAGEKLKISLKSLTWIIISWAVVFCYRYVYLMLVLAWLLYLIIKKRRQKVKMIIHKIGIGVDEVKMS